MINKTEMVGVGFWKKTQQSLHNQREIGQQLLWGFFSYIIAAGNMLDGLSPFGVAMVAACPQQLLLATSIGAIGGSLFPSGVAMSIKYAAAVLIASVARWSIFSGRLMKESFWMAPVVSGLSLLLPSLTVTLAGSFSAYDIALAFAEAILAAGSTYFFVRTAYAIRLGQGVMTLKRSDTSCAIVSLCIIMMSLSAFSFFGISLGRTVACLVILLCSVSAGEGVGTVAGAACGTAIGLALFPDLSIIGTYSISGLLTGMFSPLGKVGCSVIFLLTDAIFSLMVHQPRDALPFLYEGLIASTVFLLIPQKLMLSLKTRVFRHLDRQGDKSMKELLLSRIYDASTALKDIAQTTKQVSDRINKMKAGSIEEVYNMAIDGVCRQCGLKTRCWQHEYNDSMNCFNHFTDLLRKNGHITPEDFIYPLSVRCRKKDKIIAILNNRYGDFVEREGMNRKVAQVRSVVTDQFDGMADMLGGFGEEMVQITAYDNRSTLKIMDYLENLCLDVLSVNCYQDQNNLTFIQLYLPQFKLPRVDSKAMAKELGDICDCDFELPEQTCYEGRVRLTFRERAEYAMEFATSQHICQGATRCGDSCATFTDRKCIAHMILSDGMGSGTAAAIDSAMTVSLMTKLLDANVAYQPALKIVNSALLVKSGEESLATIDIAAIDLYTGQVDFYKAGAAPTFIKHRERTGYVDSTSLPVGILSSVDFEKSTLKLIPGDIVVMMSDGATTNGTDWIKHTIDRFDQQDSLQALCDDIAATAHLKRNDCHDDDITVVAGRLVQNL